MSPWTVLDALLEPPRAGHLRGTLIAAYHCLCSLAVCLSIYKIDSLRLCNQAVIGMSSVVSNQPEQYFMAIIQKDTRPLGLQNLS